VFKESHLTAITNLEMRSKLEGYLEDLEYNEADEELANTSLFDDYSHRAAQYIEKWSNAGYLRKYPNDEGEDIHELTTNTVKVMNWIEDLTEQRAFVGTNTENEKRKFIVVAYPYHDQYRSERDAMMGDMIEDLFKDSVKGLVVIAINIEKGHYPYSVMATRLQPLLFESTYADMVNLDPVINPSS
jgi:hypothetical protein